MSVKTTKWECTGAYDKDAYAEAIPVFNAAGIEMGWLLTYGYRNADNKTFEFFVSEQKAINSGWSFVMGCDWFDAPSSIREMYGTQENYIGLIFKSDI